MTIREDLSMQLSGLFYPGDHPNFHREADMLLEAGPVARLVEHSQTLNKISYRMAEALGLTDGAGGPVEEDPNEMVERLIALTDKH